MKAELRHNTIVLGDLRIPIEDAKKLLITTYPSILDAFVVKTGIQTTPPKGLFSSETTTEVRQVDWQGCLLHDLTKSIIYLAMSKQKQYHVKKRNVRRSP
jgi:hypothetical protein